MTSTRARIKLRRILTETDSNIRGAMQDSANLLQKEIVRNAPVDSGNLRDSITAFVAKNGLRAEVGLRGKKAKRDAFYARFIEFGSKGHKVSTRKGVLSDGNNTFGKSADIPAMPARPFIQPAWDAKKPDIMNRINKVITDAVRKAQGL